MNEKARSFTPEEMQIRQADEFDSDALALLLAELGYPTVTSPARERLIDGKRAGDSVLVAVYNSKVAEWRSCAAPDFRIALRPLAS